MGSEIVDRQQSTANEVSLAAAAGPLESRLEMEFHGVHRYPFARRVVFELDAVEKSFHDFGGAERHVEQARDALDRGDDASARKERVP